MIKDYSFILGDFELKDKDFDVFLTYYFDKNGTCKIKGIEKSKSEIASLVEAAKEKNDRYKLDLLKKRISDIKKQVSADNYSPYDITEMTNKIMNGTDRELVFLHSIHIPIKFDVLDMEIEEIKEFITNGYYDTRDQIIGIVNLDNNYYGLDSINEKESIIQREKILNEILTYKKQNSVNKY